MKSQLTIGSDPELHLFDRNAGRIVSSIPVLKRDKHAPIILGNGIKMYADNVLTELSFPPSDTPHGLVEVMRKVFHQAAEYFGLCHGLVPKACHIYEDSELQEKAAKEAGCNPNFDVYAEQANLPADFTSGLRSGSFHIHIGSPLIARWKAKQDAIKLLDIFVGCPSIIFDKDETAQERRKLYGKAGEFRPTPYGVEYRVLGNYALRSPEIVGLVVDLVVHTMSHFEEGTVDDVLRTIDREVVQFAINGHKQELVQAIMEKSRLPMGLQRRIRTSPTFAPELKW